MNGYAIEEKLSKIAAGVAGEFRSNGGKDLEGLVKQAAERHMLNDPEIETLNGKVNHLVFKEKFAEDKLDTFVISKFENILKVDRGMNMVEYKVAMYGDDPMQKAAEEVYAPGERNIEDVKITPQNAPLLMEAGEENVEQIRDLRNERDGTLDSIKNRVVALLKDGETLSDIYAVLRDTWGDENKDDLDGYFQQLVAELKADGYLKPGDSYDPEIDKLQSEDDEPLKQASARLFKIAEQIILRESAHEIIMSKLAGDYDYFAEKLENKMPDDYYGVACALYKNAATMLKTAAPAGAQVGYVRQVIPSALLAGAILAGGTALFQGGGLAVEQVRKNIWKNKLKRRYPELEQIPEERYNDLYGTIVGLEPSLLKAPYALKEMILAHDQYGTMDSSTILKLLDSGRNRHPNSPALAKAMQTGMTLRPEIQF